MKKVKEILYEKFHEKSDPVANMGIGKVTINDLTDNVDEEYDKIKKRLTELETECKEKRKKALELFVGKKITAVMFKYKNTGYSYKPVEGEYTIKVQRTISKQYESIFVSDRGTKYIIPHDSEIVVHNKS